jgi:hypothetical protein
MWPSMTAQTRPHDRAAVELGYDCLQRAAAREGIRLAWPKVTT